MIFIDSSILIESLKGNRKELVRALLSLREIRLFYNSIVKTEYLYYFLGYQGGRSPRALKEAKLIKNVISENNPLAMLSLFEQKTDAYPSVQNVIHLMNTYNLLPNDAIIMGHCLEAKIPYLASYDTDFREPCRHEGVTLLDSAEAFHSYFPLS